MTTLFVRRSAIRRAAQVLRISGTFGELPVFHLVVLVDDLPPSLVSDRCVARRSARFHRRRYLRLTRRSTVFWPQRCSRPKGGHVPDIARFTRLQKLEHFQLRIGQLAAGGVSSSFAGPQ